MSNRSDMTLVDQFLLAKLESDLRIEVSAARELVNYEKMIPGNDIALTVPAVLSNGRIENIQLQIKEIKDRYE